MHWILRASNRSSGLPWSRGGYGLRQGGKEGLDCVNRSQGREQPWNRRATLSNFRVKTDVLELLGPWKTNYERKGSCEQLYVGEQFFLFCFVLFSLSPQQRPNKHFLITQETSLDSGIWEENEINFICKKKKKMLHAPYEPEGVLQGPSLPTSAQLDSCRDPSGEFSWTNAV